MCNAKFLGVLQGIKSFTLCDQRLSRLPFTATSYRQKEDAHKVDGGYFTSHKA
jgi:hypothetical protein